MQAQQSQQHTVPMRIHNVSQEYRIIEQVGKGTYGTVYKAKCLKTGEYVAIKKIQSKDPKLQVEGFPVTALRQISLLKSMNHKNVIKMKQIIVSKPQKRNSFRGSTFLVFEYMDHDFAGLFRHRVNFNMYEIKCIMVQILEGVRYLHHSKILHRDIKSANLLFNSKGEVKIADFGLGRKFRPDSNYTSKVVTLWYRAPELLLGAKKYSDKVDIWSVGCIFAELFIGEVLFKKQTEYAQIERIFEICGGIQENNYVEAKNYPHYSDFVRLGKSYPIQHAQILRKYNPNIDQKAIQFLTALLCLNPKNRLSAEQALKHPFLTQYSPAPCKPHEIKRLDKEYHEMYKEPKPLDNPQAVSSSKATIQSTFPTGDMSFSRANSATNGGGLGTNPQLKLNSSAVYSNSKPHGYNQSNNSRGGQYDRGEREPPRRFIDDRQPPHYSSSNQAGYSNSNQGKSMGQSRYTSGGGDRGREAKRDERRQRTPERRRSFQRRSNERRQRQRSRDKDHERDRERKPYYEERYRDRKESYNGYRHQDESRRHRQQRYEGSKNWRKQEYEDQYRRYNKKRSQSRSGSRESREDRRKHYK